MSDQSWLAANHSITDLETARKACGSAYMADLMDGMTDSDLTTAAGATIIANTNVLLPTVHIADRCFIDQCGRGFQIANNMGGTFASTFAVLEASLPTSAGHNRRMISG